MASTTVYLVIEPVWAKYVPSGAKPRLEGMRVAKMLKDRPKNFSGVCVALQLNLPDAAFKPLAPKVVIDVPEGALAYEPIVTVELPDAEA